MLNTALASMESRASALAQDGWRADVIHPPAQRVGGLRAISL